MSVTRWFYLTFICILYFVANGLMLKADSPATDRGLLDFFFGPCKCRCGIPNREARLVGGEYLRGHEFPWASLIQLPGNSSFPATLINDRYLLTSANVVIGITPPDMKVTVGLFDRCFADVSSMNLSVDQITIHPDFSKGNGAHDIALIKLAIPLRYERRISPICLATPNMSHLGQVATVYGWAQSSTTNETTGSCRPRKLGLPILGYKECLQAVSDPNYISTDKGCVGVIGSLSPICKIDSGGAVTYRSYQGVYELIGILGDHNNCETGVTPSVSLYTTIKDHLSWITQNTRDACYCVKT
ncbi:hypothetical protein JTB14_015849 [Gonioctena quinquepunctata]|nr:hypothetical protein JTB14_015849 [Gonioctena quinquepunctata]